MVTLKSITKPVSEDIKNFTPEELISYTARVSNPSNQLNTETSDKLVKYLIKHKHWSPFEQVSFTVEIVTSRGISAQILRHKTFTFQEHSQRYSKSTEQILYPARRQDLKNRQNSTDDLDSEIKDWFKDSQIKLNGYANALYQEALERGIAKEQARFLLPLSTETKLYMTGTVRSWIHYCLVRCEKGTQLEHREIANECYKILRQNFPNICKILEEENEFLREIT